MDEDRSGRRAPACYRALVVDDEPMARHELRDLIDKVDWLVCVGEARTGPEAVAAIDTLRPDLVFLDIDMPGASGMEVLERAVHRPHVVFTTAHAQYAVEAFERQALDYLLKPFGERRFLAALERAHLALERRDEPAGRPPAGPLVSRAGRLFVEDRGRLVGVPFGEIQRLEADDDYVRIHTAARTYVVYGRLRDLHAKLDPDTFVRIHRSHVVSLDHVTSLSRERGGRLGVGLRDGTKLTASRRRSRGLRSRLR